MNQILYTGDKNSDAMDLKKVIRIFAIGILAYGLITLGQGVYGVIKVAEENKAKIVDPYITVEQNEEKLILKIKHNTAIEKIIYKWNSEEEVILQGRGNKEITEEIDIPVGDNVVNIRVIDNKNHEVSYTKQYSLEFRDKIKPTIEFLVEEGKIKIVAKDETSLDRVDYYWNEEDKTTINARDEEQKIIEEKISILKGENTLSVIAVDKAGNETIKEQKYIGSKKPVIEIYEKQGYVIIKASDEQGIKKIEYTFNGKDYSSDKDNTGASLNYKEAYCKEELQSGTNHIVVKAYNVNDLVAEKTVDINK